MTDIAVFVDSRGGNTKKVADTIAAELGVAAGDPAAMLPADAKVVFLGSGVYGGKPGKAMTAFIASGDFSGLKVALFATSGGAAGADKMLGTMADTLKEKGATVIGNFHCRGKYLFTNRGHPGPEDLENARKFAREMRANS
ncbi:MAG: flavodoxin [Methanoregulaceae archaeon PtaB.Bin009]|jgi:flavodoxin I|nr:MAG: flavodoxin [Methanoregulaceae archaeon PtaB.Bin009]OPY39846.1 MAG: flavodoxin [Methanoregulaceae archaeon PtaU1.Bin066]